MMLSDPTVEAGGEGVEVSAASASIKTSELESLVRKHCRANARLHEFVQQQPHNEWINQKAVEYTRDLRFLQSIEDPDSYDCGKMGELAYCLWTKMRYVRREDIPPRLRRKLGISAHDHDGSDVFEIDWVNEMLLSSMEVKNYTKSTLNLGNVVGKIVRCAGTIEKDVYKRLAPGYAYGIALSTTTTLSKGDLELAKGTAKKLLPAGVPYSVERYDMKTVLSTLLSDEDIRLLSTTHEGKQKEEEKPELKLRAWQQRAVDAVRATPKVLKKCPHGESLIDHLHREGIQLHVTTGAGKTIGSIVAAIQGGECRRGLVYCHTQDHYGMFSTIIKRMVPEARIQRVNGTQTPLDYTADWVLTTRHRSNWPIEKRTVNHFDIVVYDESHALETTNEKAAAKEANYRYQALRFGNVSGKRWILMSATGSLLSTTRHPERTVRTGIDELIVDRAVSPMDFRRLLVRQDTAGYFDVANDICRGSVKRAIVFSYKSEKLDEFRRILALVDPMMKVYLRYCTNKDPLDFDVHDTLARYVILTAYMESTGRDIPALSHGYLLDEPSTSASWSLFVQRVGRPIRFLPGKLAHFVVPVHTTKFHYGVCRLLCVLAHYYDIDPDTLELPLTLPPSTFSRKAATRAYGALSGDKKRRLRPRAQPTDSALVEFHRMFEGKRREPGTARKLMAELANIRTELDEHCRRMDAPPTLKRKKVAAENIPGKKKQRADPAQTPPSVVRLLDLAEEEGMDMVTLRRRADGQLANVALMHGGQHAHLAHIVRELAERFPPTPEVPGVHVVKELSGQKGKVFGDVRVTERAVRASLAARMLVHNGNGFIVDDSVRRTHDVERFITQIKAGASSADYDPATVKAILGAQPDPLATASDYRKMNINFTTASDNDIVRYGVSKWMKNERAKANKKKKRKAAKDVDKVEAAITYSNVGYIVKLLSMCLAGGGARINKSDHTACYQLIDDLFKYRKNKPLGVAVGLALHQAGSTPAPSPLSPLTRLLVELHNGPTYHDEKTGKCVFGSKCVCAFTAEQMAAAKNEKHSGHATRQAHYLERETTVIVSLRAWLAATATTTPPPEVLLSALRAHKHIARVLVRGVLVEDDAPSLLLRAALPTVRPTSKESWASRPHNIVRRKLVEFGMAPGETPTAAVVRFVTTTMKNDVE